MANILVVEDEIPLRELLVDHLIDEGHCPVEAGNGKEALELYASSSPDLIISDINMPIMDGYEFLKNLQSEYPDVEDVPFFFLSALSDSDDQIKGLNFGIDEYLCKPVDFGVLTTRIELSLSRQQKIKQKIADALTMSKPEPEEIATSTKADGLPSNASDHSDDVSSTFEGLLGSKRSNLSRAQKDNINIINSPKNFNSSSIINNIGRKVNISRLFIRKDKYNSMIEDISSSEFDESFFLDVTDIFYSSVMYFLDRNNFVRERALIIPCIYECIEHEKIRDSHIKMLDHIQDKYSISTISEVVNISSQISACEDALKPLSARKSPQILEIKRLEQIKGIKLANLRIGAISMN